MLYGKLLRLHRVKQPHVHTHALPPGPPRPQPTLEAITQQRAELPGRHCSSPRAVYLTRRSVCIGATLSEHSGVRGFLRF